MLKLSRRNFTKYIALSLAVMVAVSAPLVQDASASSNLVAKYIIKGRIGEQYDGLLGFVDAKRATDKVIALVEQTNQERMAKYKIVAAQNGTTVEKVQLLAGKELIKKLRVGSYYKTQAGDWMRKQ